MDPIELRRLADRIAAETGRESVVCMTCFGSCVSRVPHGKSPTGFVVSDPCATCHGGGRLWKGGRDAATATD